LSLHTLAAEESSRGEGLILISKKRSVVAAQAQDLTAVQQAFVEAPVGGASGECADVDSHTHVCCRLKESTQATELKTVYSKFHMAKLSGGQDLLDSRARRLEVM
jgi:hypothetical protein